MGTILRIGDIEGRPEEACEIIIKMSKCTALARPKGWKKFGRRGGDEDEDEDEDMEKEGKKVAYAQLTTRTEYYVDRTEGDEDGDEDKIKPEDDIDVDMDNKNESAGPNIKERTLEKVEREQLVRGFKYGSTYAPCPDGQFPKLKTRKGIDICGFFYAKNVRPSPSNVSSPI